MLLRPEALWDGRERRAGCRYITIEGTSGKLGVNRRNWGSCGGVRQTISLIERGDYSPSVSLALKLAAICGTTVEDIFTYEDE